MTWLNVDYETLISQCVHHLADLGHRDIALVNRSAELVAAGYGPGHRAQPASHELSPNATYMACTPAVPATLRPSCPASNSSSPNIPS